MTSDLLRGMIFEPRDIMRILGVDKNRLIYWSNTHRLFRAEIAAAKGPGERSKYSLKNLIEIEAIKQMLKHGFSLKLIKKIKDEFDRAGIFDSLSGPCPLLKGAEWEFGGDEDHAEIFEKLMAELPGRWLKERYFEIYKSENGIIIFETGLKWDFKDGGQYISRTPLTKNAGQKPLGYFATRFELGNLVYDLFEKLEKIYAEKLTQK